MSKSTIGWRRAGLSSLATTALIFGTCLVGAGTASADAGFNFNRIGGDDRYDTSALVADEYGDSDNVIIANGQPGNYADALTANYLSGEQDAPVLLTRANQTPDSVQDELADLGAENVTIVGGTGVVSSDQEDALSDDYNVNRVSGTDRFETNADVIEAGGAADGDLGFIATGFNFPDALAGGPLSYSGHPLGLSSSDDIDDSVIDALTGAGVDHVAILGGVSAVGPEVEAKLAANGITVDQRLSGTGRAGTSVAAANYAVDELGFSNEGVNVASGYVQGYGADALAGGPLTGQENRPLLVTTNVDNPSDAVLSYLEDNSSTLTDGTIFGGTSAVSTDAQAAMEDAAQTPRSNQDLAVMPGDDATLTLADETGADATSDDRQFTATGLDDSTTYTVALFPADNVSTNADGEVVFEDSAGTADEADDYGDTDTAHVSAANNVPTTGSPGAADVTPVSGNVSFTIDGDDAGSVVPVLFVDNDGGAANSQVDLNADNQPTEDFGIGGETTYVEAEAGGGPIAGGGVASVDKANNSFSDADETFFYDSNDTYAIGGTPVTMANFESQLSRGDTVSGTYAPDSDASSTFDLTDTAPTTPTSLSASQTAGAEQSSVDLSWTASTEPTGGPDSYNVYANDEATTDTTAGELEQIGSTDGDTTTFTADGLSADTTYTFVVTAEVNGDESAVAVGTAIGDTDNTVEQETAQTPNPVTITSADLTTDAVPTDAPTTGDVWTVTFSNDIDTSTTAANATFTLEESDGDEILVDCGGTAGVADDVTDATCAAGAGDDADQLVVTLAENGEDRSASGDGTVLYPLTITDTGGVVDNDNNGGVNLDDSDDTTIG